MKIKFVPQNVEVEVDSNRSVLELAKEAGLQIKSVCGGTPSCAECKIQIAEGEYNVLPPSEKELSLIGTAHFVDHSRLSCQLRCFGNVTIDLHEQIEKQKAGAQTKKPRGKAQKGEGEESFAVEGSILLGGVDLELFGTAAQIGIDRTNERRSVEVFNEDETKRALEQIRKKRERERLAKEEGEEDDDYLKKLRTRNRKLQDYGDKDEEALGEAKEVSKKNSRPHNQRRTSSSPNVAQGRNGAKNDRSKSDSQAKTEGGAGNGKRRSRSRRQRGSKPASNS